MWPALPRPDDFHCWSKFSESGGAQCEDQTLTLLDRTELPLRAGIDIEQVMVVFKETGWENWSFCRRKVVARLAQCHS